YKGSISILGGLFFVSFPITIKKRSYERRTLISNGESSIVKWWKVVQSGEIRLRSEWANVYGGISA
ncbi:hypothetical protein, partial [Paenibacillus macquariensis]|uniref:hypothetical protein n=1 Tax=Paenibacillus macquariensis TaxID=948756 RepID=UPI002DBF7822